MINKIPSRLCLPLLLMPILLLPILLMPILASAQSGGIDIVKPSRPGRKTIPQTQVVESSLPDPEEDLVREASIAAMVSLTSPLLPQPTPVVSPLAISLINVLPPAWFGFGTALNPLLGGVPLSGLIATSPATPPQFLVASSPAASSLAGASGTRQAHVAASGPGALYGGLFPGTSFFPFLEMVNPNLFTPVASLALLAAPTLYNPYALAYASLSTPALFSSFGAQASLAAEQALRLAYSQSFSFYPFSVFQPAWFGGFGWYQPIFFPSFWGEAYAGFLPPFMPIF